MTTPEQKARLEKLEDLRKLKAEFQLLTYKPYAKQLQFHNLRNRERGLIAGNRLGKTMSAGMEVAMHLTGFYPEWWEGKRYRKPVRLGVGSKTGDLLKRGPQKMLMGDNPAVFGTGTIPRALIHETKAAKGVSDGLDSVRVRYTREGKPTGEVSEALFLSYEEGRESWQSDNWDGAWLDEEPPIDVYTEALTRTNTTLGLIWFTATPMLGMSDVIRRYLNHEGDTGFVSMGVHDVDHFTSLSKTDQDRWLSSYPEWERKARLFGEPMLGEGAIFQFDTELLLVEPFEIPRHYAVLGAMDFGIDHPFAAVKVAYDRDSDTMYVTNTYRQRGLTPVGHCSALRHWGNIPWAWPHDGLQRDKNSGKQLAQFYRENGLSLLSEHAQYAGERGNGLWASITDLDDRMKSGRLKVFRGSQHQLFEEIRFYHQTDGKPMPEHDDLIAAVRYAAMMLRYAEVEEPLPVDDRYARAAKKRHSLGWLAA